MNYIDLNFETGNGLRRVAWRFWLYDTALVLDFYLVQTRQTRRHSFKTTESYTRMPHPSERFSGRSLPEAEVPLTPEIAEAALREYTSKLRVVRWSEVKP